VLHEIKERLDKNLERILPKILIGLALNYCLKYWDNLMRYIEDGRSDTDNNLTEHAIKHFATGRKNSYDLLSNVKRTPFSRYFFMISTNKKLKILLADRIGHSRCSSFSLVRAFAREMQKVKK